MKIQKIASICKSNNTIVIYTGENGEQWISNGYACYRLGGLPKITGEEALVMFDISAENRGKWTARDLLLPTELYNFYDVDDEEYEIFMLPLRLVFNADILCFFVDGDKLHAVNKALLAPFMPYGEYLRFYKRAARNPDSDFSLIVKNGLLVEGLILPYACWGKESFANAFNSLAVRGLEMLRHMGAEE
ncbi:MAG: hypothetical protein LBK23_05065 [Oscillospiraceae bacterium]|nr:hypothetical protein [Oscillospiraceae bacterium]